MKRAVVAVASLSTSEGLAASRLTPCWSCKGPVDVRALFCSVCGAVQGPGSLDHFTRLGLPLDYHVEAADLDRQYFGFQRRMHPDRFAAKSAKEKALSQAQATALNDAYETLSDPVKRAVYLLKQVGHDSHVDGDHTISDTGLLMEQMELRETLAEADTIEQVSAFLQAAEASAAECQQALALSFRDEDYLQAAKLVLRLTYLTKLVEDARGRKTRIVKGH